MNTAELALAVALDDSVEFFLTDVHDCKLTADKKVCISRSSQMGCPKQQKNLNSSVTGKIWLGVFFLFFF